MADPGKQLMQLFSSNDYSGVDRLLRSHPELRSHLNDGVFDWNMPPLAAAKSQEMVDVLLRHGADIDVVTKWWSPGFGTKNVDPDTARGLVQRGASLSIHAATGIGLGDIVAGMLDDEPALIRAKGGDGCHPLHFCTDADLAAMLIERGAEIDARDDDHFSTPAQWRIQDAPEIVRLLLAHGAEPDIFMAAGLGDLDLATKLVKADPTCTEHRIGNNHGPFPGIGYQDRGGTIYQWSLGFNLSPHEVALRRGRKDIYDLLWDHSTPRAKLLVACTTANRPLAQSVVQENPNITNQLGRDDHELLAKFCWETNKSIEAVRLMIDLGFPLDVPEQNHGYTALHNAAWCGDPDLVALLIQRGHATDLVDPQFDATAIGYAVHSCLEAKRHPEGRFDLVVGLLLEAGTPFDAKYYPVGHKAIDKVLRRHLDTAQG